MIPEDEDLDPDYPDQEEYYVDESHYDPYAGCHVYDYPEMDYEYDR